MAAEDLPTHIPSPDTTPASTGLSYFVDDPYGTPADNAATLANIVTKAHGLSDGVTTSVNSGVLISNTASTSRTNLGLATSDSPQFAGVNVGDASDTTVTRASAGNLNIEGNLVYRAGGTDVPLTDGGTGASTAAGALANFSGQAGADFSLNSHKLTSVTDPSSAQDAATKAYVDAVAQGLSVKPSALVGTTAALPTYTYLAGVITATATGVVAVDGHNLADNDIVLVKDETSTNKPYNGLYTVTTAGAVGVALVMTRHTSMDASTEFSGAFVFVESGTVNTGAGFVCTNTGSTNVGVDDVTFVQFSGAGEITVGSGLTKSGNLLDRNALTGDISASAGSNTTTLATVNSNVGTFGSATKASVVTVNAKGLVTAASETTVTPAVGSITGLGTGVGTFLATPSSANLASAITDETGSGALVFATSPGFTTAANPISNDGAALGTTALQWSDLFLAEGAVINWDNGDATLTQVGNMVTLAGADLTVDNLTANTALLPDANDGAAIGNATTAFSDLFLAEGGVINWDNGDATITQSGNTVTLAGANLNATPEDWTGWYADSHTWTYSSASAFTIAGVDLRTTFQSGTAISWNDGSVKYGVVKSSSFSTDTTVNIIVNDDYTIANATITAPRYAYATHPQGFPSKFEFTPTYTGFSSNPTNGAYFYSNAGRLFVFSMNELNNGTSNSTSFSYTIPITMVSIAGTGQEQATTAFSNNGTAGGTDGNSTTFGTFRILDNSATINLFTDASGGAWTAASTGKRCRSGTVPVPIA